MTWTTETPTSPGWYWAKRIGTKFVPHGSITIIEIQRTPHGSLWPEGYGDEELEEIAYEWQPVVPPEE